VNTLEDRTKRNEIIKILGWIGIISVLITILSDFILLGKPSSAYDYFVNGTKTMWDIPEYRITMGSFIGVVILPFQVMGLIPVYDALKPAGKIIPAVVLMMFAHALLMGVAFHISYAYIGSAWKLYHLIDAKDITLELINQYDIYWTILIVTIAAEILVSSVIYSVVIAKRKTLYPQWMAIFSPAIVVACTLVLVVLIPSPLGGYFAPAFLNISTIVFFLLTQTNKSPNRE
jgi:hypothetical protein